MLACIKCNEEKICLYISVICLMGVDVHEYVQGHVFQDARLEMYNIRSVVMYTFCLRKVIYLDRFKNGMEQKRQIKKDVKLKDKSCRKRTK